jgi:CBS domain-containing protein
MDALETPVRQVMTAPLVTVDGDRPLGDVAGQFGRDGVGSLVVRTESGDGIVTEGDVVAAVAEGIDPSITPVRDVMSAPLVTVPASATLRQVTERMDSHRVKHLPVVEDDEVVGIVTSTDVVAALAPNLDEIVRLFAGESADT